MATALEKKAKEAFFDDEFGLAVDLYSEAIRLDPNDANLFADRAQAHIKLNAFTEAVSDANKSIQLNPSLPKAYLRKATACIKLQEYHTAKVALQNGAAFAQDDSRFANLIQQCDRCIAEESSGLTSTLSSHLSNRNHGMTKEEAEGDSLLSQKNEATLNRPKYRHEYYQKPEEVVVTIFAKGISAKDVVVDFGEQILSVTIDVPGQDAYHYQPRLFGKIIPNNCRVEVLSTKIEIRLAKAEAINWTSLEYGKNTLPPIINRPIVQSERASYPSPKPRTKDWDKLEAQVKKEEKEEKLDGDAALNKLFRDIYQNADEDMRRAMSKSFLESNGTVLSTDWKEVGSKKVEGSPPEGMELKKWEY
ncbi:protein SGT1 homolog A-like [Glycine soja]|uniref:Protein SGT1-like B isoform A n=1 Tax=Glycine soja TaxID=3848 RepID=A0A445M6Q1_GLYSO|nr:protein SGT1 homolog A-like [Glycine soja]RZC31282.1 Protein SGT1-like B isoform A [Glycine soja]